VGEGGWINTVERPVLFYMGEARGRGDERRCLGEESQEKINRELYAMALKETCKQGWLEVRTWEWHVFRLKKMGTNGTCSDWE